MTPKKFWTKKAALAAVKDCQLSGWTCGIIGARAPFLVQAISSREDEAATGIFVKYDLCTDGKFYEYSRKAIATEKKAQWTQAEAREFGDHRSAEEMVAHYGEGRV